VARNLHGTTRVACWKEERGKQGRFTEGVKGWDRLSLWGKRGQLGSSSRSYYATFSIDSTLKDTVRRKLRWVKSGINQ
jgi:hypothetical protein